MTWIQRVAKNLLLLRSFCYILFALAWYRNGCICLNLDLDVFLRMFKLIIMATDSKKWYVVRAISGQRK